MTSAAIGATVAGLRVVLVHIRIDFIIFLRCNNKLAFIMEIKSNNKSSAPVVIRT